MKKDSLYDSIRKKSFCALPEEKVRQKLLSHMRQNLGYPKELLVIEAKIDELPHLKTPTNTNRRADIICYSHDMLPLIMIECKAGSFTKNALYQVLGYNEIVGARFIGLADAKKVHVYYRSEKGLEKLEFLPSYEELKRCV